MNFLVSFYSFYFAPYPSNLIRILSSGKIQDCILPFVVWFKAKDMFQQLQDQHWHHVLTKQSAISPLVHHRQYFLVFQIFPEILVWSIEHCSSTDILAIWLTHYFLNWQLIIWFLNNLLTSLVIVGPYSNTVSLLQSSVSSLVILIKVMSCFCW